MFSLFLLMNSNQSLSYQVALNVPFLVRYNTLEHQVFIYLIM